VKKSHLIGRKGRKGFTLLEALFAVLLVAVLAAVAVPMYANTLTQSKLDTCKCNIRAIATADSKFKFDTGAYATSVASLITYGLAEVPACPAGGTYAISVTNVISCSAAGHGVNSMTMP